VRVELERALVPAPAPVDPRVRPAESRDLPALRAIARTSHHDSRFYCDARFSRARCDALYETWIEKSCQGGAAAVLVADLDGGRGLRHVRAPAPAAGRIGSSRSRPASAGAAGDGLVASGLAGSPRAASRPSRWRRRAETSPRSSSTRPRVPHGGAAAWYHRWRDRSDG
jgi:hypothetical protein